MPNSSNLNAKVKEQPLRLFFAELCDYLIPRGRVRNILLVDVLKISR